MDDDRLRLDCRLNCRQRDFNSERCSKLESYGALVTACDFPNNGKTKAMTDAIGVEFAKKARTRCH